MRACIHYIYRLASELPCTTQCPCGWVGIAKFYTKAELERKVQSIQRELTVSKETLSATVSMKNLTVTLNSLLSTCMTT